MSSLGAPSKAPGHPEPSLSSSRLSPKSRFVNQEQILWFLFRLSALHQACGICQLVTSLSPCVNLSCLCLDHQGHNLEALQHFQEKSHVVLALSVQGRSSATISLCHHHKDKSPQVCMVLELWNNFNRDLWDEPEFPQGT